MLLCFLLIAGTIIYYHSENEPIYAWSFLIIALAILIGLSQDYGPLSQMLADETASFQCADGTVVSYGEAREIRDKTDQTRSEVLADPPPHWCDESLDWYDELIDQYIVYLISLFGMILFVVCLLMFWIDFKLGLTFKPVSVSNSNFSSSNYRPNRPTSKKENSQ